MIGTNGGDQWWGQIEGPMVGALGLVRTWAPVTSIWLAVPKVRKSGPVGWKIVDVSRICLERDLLIF